MTESWRLKRDRAKHHLSEVERYLRAFEKLQPYKAVRVPPGKKNRRRWRFKLEMTAEPDEMLPIVVGEVVYSLRSALDHLAVAIAPRKRVSSASFPIEEREIWRQTPSGQYLIPNDDARKAFLSRIEGIDPEAAAIIEEMQPYHFGEEIQENSIRFISRLENADKHRQLVAVATGLSGVTTITRARGETISQGGGEPYAFRKNGAIIADFEYIGSPPLREAEVDVEVQGTPEVVVALKGARELPEFYPVRENCVGGIHTVGEIFEWLEPYVRADAR